MVVSFPHLPEPTDDPTVWHFRPSVPGRGPVYYEIQFSAKVVPAAVPCTVEGTARLQVDGLRRVGKVPGVVILDGAVLRESP